MSRYRTRRHRESHLAGLEGDVQEGVFHTKKMIALELKSKAKELTSKAKR
jgi:hypothetical protein